VANILILSINPILADQWKTILSKEHKINIADTINHAIGHIQTNPTDILIIDADAVDFDTDTTALAQIRDTALKALIIGREWSEDQQIHALISGFSGYCEYEATAGLLLKATNSLLKGDIWIQRHLVPKVIGHLIELTNAQTIQPEKTTPANNNLQTLTHRELDVAKMIRAGESNKTIASLLNISERTVKAHLTSIFQKLEVQDRLHLAVLLKEIIQ
jgi:two-component system nitrate/nitrite response regulator NarL